MMAPTTGVCGAHAGCDGCFDSSQPFRGGELGEKKAGWESLGGSPSSELLLCWQ